MCGDIGQHSASLRSVLRPGTFFTCCALHSRSLGITPSRTKSYGRVQGAVRALMALTEFRRVVH